MFRLSRKRKKQYKKDLALRSIKSFSGISNFDNTTDSYITIKSFILSKQSIYYFIKRNKLSLDYYECCNWESFYFDERKWISAMSTVYGLDGKYLKEKYPNDKLKQMYCMQNRKKLSSTFPERID